MGSSQSRITRDREREFERLAREREDLRRAREEQLQEELRLEKEKNLFHRAREDLAVKALQAQQEALRISNAGTQSQLYPSLNNTAGFRNETYQTTAAPNLAVNYDHFRFQPSAPPAPFAPKVHQPSSETRTLSPLRPPTINRPPTETGAAPPAAMRTTTKCPNAADGCQLSFVKKIELTKHEKECPFKELKCPALVNCNWRGKISQLSIHFDEEHPSSRQANVNTEMYLSNIDKDFNSLQLIKIGTYNFLFYVKVSEIDSMIYMAVKLIGTKMSASKWNYEIHVFNKSEPRRKYQYVDSCHSDEIPGILLCSCAVLPLPYARSFVNKGKLTYKLYIKKRNNN